MVTNDHLHKHHAGIMIHLAHVCIIVIVVVSIVGSLGVQFISTFINYM